MRKRHGHEPPSTYSFVRHLQDGETLLWHGQPRVSAFVWPKLVRDGLLIALAMPPLVWLDSLRPGHTLRFGSWEFWACVLLAYASGLWHVYRETRLQARQTHYALTDRRVFVRHLVTLPTRERRARVDELPLATLRPRLSQPFSKWGSITFDLSPLRYDLAFRAIPDAAEVFALLEGARATLPGAALDLPYYTRHRQRPAFTLEAHLRRSEQVLWQGRPDRVGYIRQEMRVALFCGVFLVALFGGLELAAHHLFSFLHFSAVIAAGVMVLSPLLYWLLGLETGSLDYFVTSQRVLIVKHTRWGMHELYGRDMAATDRMRLVRGTGGTGTLIFEKRSRFVWHGQSGTVVTEQFAFQSIAGAEEVFRLITQAQRQAESAREKMVQLAGA